VAKIKGDTMFSMGPFLSSLVNFLLTAVRPEDEVGSSYDVHCDVLGPKYLALRER
jgi:hypothetical protein